MLSPMTAGVALVVALIVFGPKKIPEIANALGKSLNEFKKGMGGMEESFRDGLEGHNHHAPMAQAPRIEAPTTPAQQPAQVADAHVGENR